MTIVIWQCKLCKSIQISNSKQHHCMDFCKCDKLGYDLEEYGARLSANNLNDFIVLGKIKHTDVWQELSISATEQDFTKVIEQPAHIFSTKKIKSRVFKNEDNIDILREIEREVYLSFLK